jgi:biopolymer transport protein ExbD
MIGGKHIGAHQQKHAEPMSEINTTPLVDVMLVLLVIFIITAPLLTHAVKIDLPKASSQLLIEKPEVISISINQFGHRKITRSRSEKRSTRNSFKSR